MQVNRSERPQGLAHLLKWRQFDIVEPGFGAKMAAVWTYRRSLEELWDRSSYERGFITDPFGDADRAARSLRRMRELLRLLDDPQLRPATVHVAGSKGKGSTAGFIAAAATTAGVNTGVYTSPHLHRFPERIAIGGLPVSDETFASLAMSVADATSEFEAANPDGGTVTTFEFITAMAFLGFARAGCELAVIEVGLGGLYDATNVLQPIATVITRLDYEHTAVLGESLSEIATQKAGIMRRGVPCLSAPQTVEAEIALIRLADEAGAPLGIGRRDWNWQGDSSDFSATGPWGTWHELSLATPGPHQVENACTALAALHCVNQAGIAIPQVAIRQAFATAQWPGRFERIEAGGRVFVFDGAHTPAAAAALAETWQAHFGNQRVLTIVGMGSDKQPGPFLHALQPVVSELVATRARSPRAMDPTRIVAESEALGIPTRHAPSVEEAIESVSPDASPLVLITGSLFVAGEGREALGLAAPDDIWDELNTTRLASNAVQLRAN